MTYSEEFDDLVLLLVSNNYSITEAAKMTCDYFNVGYNDSIRRRCSALVNSEKEDVTEEELIDEVFEASKNKEFDKSKKRFIISWCQSDTKIHEQFMDNIESYANKIDASIHIILGRYKNPTSLDVSNKMKSEEKSVSYNWDKRVVKYADSNRHNIHKYLCVASDLKIQPTASTPLSGLNSLTGLESCIVGHPRVHMKSLPVLDGYPSKLVMSTGSVSLENYTDTKAGKKGEFHHTLGFVIVELDGDVFHTRQVQCSEDGSFYDLCFLVDNGEVCIHSGAEAVVFGDLHLGETSDEALGASFKMCELVDCKEVILHDAYNGHSISHHEKRNPFILMQREKDGSNCLKKELSELVSFFEEYQDYNFTLVRSNHDEWLDRWLKESDWRKEGNREMYLTLANLMALNPVNNGALDLFLKDVGVENAHCLNINDSYIVGDFELAIHGHVGANGSRGGIVQFKNMNTKTITGHSHSPAREDGAIVVGTLTHLRVSYNSGASSWMNSNAIIYPNGKASNVHIVNGKFTTLV